MAPGSLTAHLATLPHPGESHTLPKGIHLGRERVNWSAEVWERIDRAVHHETIRAQVAAKFLPHHRVDSHITTIPADVILPSIALNGIVTPLLNVDEGAITRLIEIWVEFSMTAQQVEQETKLHRTHHDVHGDGHAEHSHHRHDGYSTAATLATRAANILSQAQDTILFQGQNAFANSPLFQNKLVLSRGTPSDFGLLNIGGIQLQAVQVVKTGPPNQPAKYSENTVARINEAYSRLQNLGHYGPYACVLYFYPYADCYAPLPTTLIMPVDRIKPLMTEGFFGTGTVPGIPASADPATQSVPGLPTDPAQPKVQSVGLVLSTGGNTMDLVIGQDPVAGFMQQDPDGNFRFRVLERFALRLKDSSAVIRLEFQ